MSKELIEKLREKADSLTTTVGVMNLLHEAADALEAKAAPVAYITGQFAGRCVIEAINRAAVLPTGMALYATPQPSAGVVMPEIPWQWSKSLTHCWPDDKDDRDGDWCVGCIDEEGNFYEVVKVEASQYDAAGESQKIAEAIVALWEFARLNGKEVGRG